MTLPPSSEPFASFSGERSAAIRNQLIDTAARARAPRRRPMWAIALVVAGALAGAGVSTAAFAASGTFTPNTPAAGRELPAATDDGTGAAITAPPGTAPGSPVISLIGKTQSLLIDAPTELSLADRPGDATHVRVTLTAVSAASVSWGTDAGGNNPSASFDAADVGRASAVTWYDFPLDDTTTTFFFDVDADGAVTATMQYLRQVPTHLAVNARGETYGVEGGPDGTPDLISVGGVAPDGSSVEGYARNTDLNAFSPDHTELPSNPAEALAWQEERAEKYPNGWDVDVYDSDGVTVIGSFHIG
ncbi:hypothetical protein [Microbacterium saperdae]|uniref:Uncharacterized protein n=1 Tax=Microbacterium saperdae TaxID=69368 RepID=A0A543B9H6_9MICO|nr:hypothetical protein [Microbacterium saperdae]TQL81495.1 hypothetical protein FB560_2967 [Microbacterium saperdae]GGM59957.1 hypothetical protein GCM10010489_34370 [Microbacterium saperdae]